MMEFKFKCPHCDQEITEKDFQAGTKTFNHLQQYFEKQRQQYVENLKQELAKKWAIAEKLKIEAAVSSATSLWQQKLNEKTNQLKEIIAKNNIQINNHEEKLKAAIANLSNQLNQEKHQAITALEKTINANQIVIEKHEAHLAAQLAAKEKQLNDEKHLAIAKLREEINRHVNENNLQQAKLETVLLQKEKALATEHQKVVANLNQQIEDLKIANNQYRIIQNKTKGENFEHEVEAELRKVFEPNDLIEKITAKDQKADYLHAVRQQNEVLGKIVYEVKNAEWSNHWEKKLVDDIIRQKAQYGMIICTTFNKKFPGIPFKRSDEHENIYLCDTESFCFVGQILRTLIKIEANLVKQAKHDDYHAKIQQFNNWKTHEFPKFSNLFQDSLKTIEENERLIIAKVGTIQTTREKIQKQFLKNIYNFLNTISFS